MDGVATLGTDKYDIVLVFAKANDAWLVSGINITAKK
jgi:hypothetical protein